MIAYVLLYLILVGILVAPLVVASWVHGEERLRERED